MAGNDRYGSMSDKDLCEYLKEVEDTYGVRIRISLVPLSKASGKSTHAIIAAAYNLGGKRIGELERAQCMFPGGTSRTFTGAAFYVATQLTQEIDTWSVRATREAEQFEPGRLSALEEYIANSFQS